MKKTLDFLRHNNYNNFVAQKVRCKNVPTNRKTKSRKTVIY